MAEDHKTVREGTRQLLAQASDLTIIGDAADGEKAVRHPHIAHKVVEQLTQRQLYRSEEMMEGLTKREIEVLQAVAQGKSNREIGKALCISPHIQHRLTLVSMLPVALLGAVVTLVSIYALREISLNLILQRKTALVQVAAAGMAKDLNGYLL